MARLLGLLLLGIIAAANSERHSLTYIYTALSRPVLHSGVHEFSAMGLLDTKMIDYYDSHEQKKIPKQQWMKSRLSEDYWSKGTASRRSKQHWFKVNLDILQERKNQSDQDIHVLQWMHGCEAELTGGKLRFERGIDQYSYDGDTFLYFDDAHSVWVAAAREAEPTKRKWDMVQVLKDYTKGYLEKECLEWLGKFLEYDKQEPKPAKAPDVYVFASPARYPSNVRLNCLATGFYPPDIVINLLRDGTLLSEDILTTGIRPNQDDTYQRRDSIEILRTDRGQYSCQVIHAPSDINIIKTWDGDLLPHPGDGVPVATVAVSVAVIVLLSISLSVAVVVYKKKQRQADPHKAPESDVLLVVSTFPGVGPNTRLIPTEYSPEDSPASSVTGSVEDVKDVKDKTSDSDSAVGSSYGSAPDSVSAQSTESLEVSSDS